MPRYICTDGNADVAYTAKTPLAAASDYVYDGDYRAGLEGTTWVDVYVELDVSDIEERMRAMIGDLECSKHASGWWVYNARALDLDAMRAALPECQIRLDNHGDLDIDHHHGRECFSIEVDPVEPDCADGKEHDWQSPYEVVGGIKENPGVWGKGGGVVIKRCCAHCGRYQIRDTWAQRMDTGEQGLESVSYEDADELSRSWVEAE